MDRQQLLARLDTAWAALRQSYAGLSESQLTQPGAVGDWSVKDILAHVTTWEEESLKYLPILARGDRLPRDSTTMDAFNSRMAEQKRHLPLSGVLAQLDETHRRLVDYIASAPDELLARETPFRRRLRSDTYRHYPEHARAIREWRERSGG